MPIKRLMIRLLRSSGEPRPEPGAAESTVMARSLGALYLAGATIGQLSLFLPRAPGTNVGALELNIALAYLGGVLVLVIFRRLPVWTFHIAMLAGTLLITRAIYYSGDVVSYYGVWYVWVALFSFSFFRRGEAVIHIALAGAAYAAVLAVRGDPVAEARWLTTIASLLIAGIFIDALVRRIQRQHRQALDQAEHLSAVIDAMHRAFQQPDADATRVDLCATAAAVVDADSVILWEPVDQLPALTPVARCGKNAPVQQVLLEGACEGVAQAYLDGRASFSSRAEEYSLELAVDRSDTVRAVLWQPVLRDEITVAVLALYWTSPVAAPEQSVRATIALLAVQAAVAIERADLLAQLERSAHTDELTGLPNRRAWQQQLPVEMARARREGSQLCIAMLDVDGLKQINDKLGHRAGDQLLKQSAAGWSGALRKADLLVRYGGDEFAALLTQCDLADARRLIGRLVEATPSEQSFSVGIAEWDGVQGLDELVAIADARLYEAKARAEASWSRPAVGRTDGPSAPHHQPSVGQRQREANPGPDRRVGEPDLPAVGLDDRPRYRQAKAGHRRVCGQRHRCRDRTARRFARGRDALSGV
jgi:diguanylate cyclase (GGDEF)-like protein